MSKKSAIILIIVLVFILIGGGVYYLWEYTEVFGKKLIPIKVESITIQYTPGFSVKDANTFNQDEKKTVEKQVLSLKGNDFKNLKRVVKGIKKGKNLSGEVFKDEAEIIINDKITVQISDGVGYVQKGKSKTKVKVPHSCYEEVMKMIDKNNQKVIQNFTAEAVTVKIDGASIAIKNPDNLKYINDSFAYYPVTIDIPYSEYENGYQAEIILNDKRIYLYKDRIGYIVQKEGEQDTSTYVVFIEDLYDLIQQIYQKSIA